MVKVLIIGTPRDYHSMAVQWGLQKLGAEVSFWVPADLPDMARLSIALCGRPACTRLTLRALDRQESLTKFNVAWNRRRGKPLAPKHSSPHDAVAIEVECQAHLTNSLTLLSKHIPMINDPSAQNSADQKALQLEIASRVGFIIPNTIISNSIEDIRAFQARFTKAIFKPYKPHVWLGDVERFSQLTAYLPDISSISPQAVEACPIIVQEYIVRRCEIRLTVFGDHFFPIKIAGESSLSHLDARYEIRKTQDCFEIVEIPAAIRQRCKDYMDSFGIVFGAFDFIINENDEWIFLECNEAGQFLFKEQRLSELGLLDTFCRWVIQVGGADPGSISQERISLLQLSSSPEFEAIVKSQNAHKNSDVNTVFHDELELELGS